MVGCHQLCRVTALSFFVCAAASEECAVKEAEKLAEHGSAMLQTRRLTSRGSSASEESLQLELSSELSQSKGLSASEESLQLDDAEIVNASVGDFSQSSEIMTDVPITEIGFARMQAECCDKAFDKFTRKLLVALWLDVCDEGCHNGFMPFFSCGKSDTLESFKEHILKKSTEDCGCYKPVGKCPPGGFSPNCKAPNPGVYNPSWNRRRACVKCEDALSVAVQAAKQKDAGTAEVQQLENAIDAAEAAFLDEKEIDEAQVLLENLQAGIGAKTMSTTVTPKMTTTMMTSTKKSSTSIRTSTRTTRAPTETTKVTTTAITPKASSTMPTTTTTTTIVTTRTTTRTSTKIKTTTTRMTTTTTTIACASASLLDEASSLCLAAGLGDEYWLNQCMTQVCSDCATAGTDCSKEVASSFDVTGNPKDWCWADLVSYATAACFDELYSNCMVSDAWLEMCIEDVCAASQSGDPNPLAAAKSYCDNQLSIPGFEATQDTAGNGATQGANRRILIPDTRGATSSEAGPCSYTAHSNYCIGPNNENLKKTFIQAGEEGLPICKELCDSDDSCSAVEWYPTGNAGGMKCFHILDTIRAARGFPLNKQRKRQIICYIKQCEGKLACAQSPGVEATDSQTRCVIPATPAQCEELASGASVTMQNSTWKTFPKYCSRAVSGGQVTVRWNMNPGAVSSTDSSSRQICCGSDFLPATTTTTTEVVAFEPSRAFNKPPLRPDAAYASAVTVQRPDSPVVGACLAFGDPHIRPFDSPANIERKHMVNSYTTGNYWMVKSDAIWIQAHQAGRRLVSGSVDGKKFKNYAHVTKVAVGGPFLQGNTLMLEGIRDGAQVWWNEEVILSGAEQVGSKTTLDEMSGAVKIVRENTKTTFLDGETALRFKLKVELPQQVELSVTVHPRDEQVEASTFDLVVKMLQVYGMDGQCGNFNGNYDDDIPTKAGGIMDRFGGTANRIQSDELLIPY